MRQFVEAFLLDHGRIHVGDEQRLAAAGERLHDDIDRPSVERAFDLETEALKLLVPDVEKRVESDARFKPLQAKRLYACRCESLHGRIQSEFLARRGYKNRNMPDSRF